MLLRSCWVLAETPNPPQPRTFPSPCQWRGGPGVSPGQTQGDGDFRRGCWGHHQSHREVGRVPAAPWGDSHGGVKRHRASEGLSIAGAGAPGTTFRTILLLLFLTTARLPRHGAALGL